MAYSDRQGSGCDDQNNMRDRVALLYCALSNAVNIFVAVILLCFNRKKAGEIAESTSYLTSGLCG